MGSEPMKTNASTRITAIALLAVGLGMAGYGLWRFRAAKTELAIVRERQTRLQSAIAVEKLAIEKEVRERQRRQAAIAAARPSNAKKAGRTQINTLPTLLSSHPKLLDQFLRSYRASLSQRLLVYYQMAGLSPAQIASFEALATKHQAEATNLAAAAAAEGLDQSDPAIAALRQQQDEQFRADQIALLGDAGYRQLLDFNRSAKALDLVNGAAQLAADPADAYTSTQAEQLMQIVANASPQYQQGGAVDTTSVDWDRVLAQAAPILSPPQLDALRTQAQAIRLVAELLPSYRAQQAGK